MKRMAATVALVLALTAASVTISTEEASANPLIFGIAAWKFVTIVAASLVVGGAIGASAARSNAYAANGYGGPEGCPVHISRSGHRYTRANCT